MDTGAVKVACPVLWGGWGSNGLSLPALYPGMTQERPKPALN